MAEPVAKAPTRDSAGLPSSPAMSTPPPLPEFFSNLSPGEQLDDNLLVGSSATSHRALRRFKRKLRRRQSMNETDNQDRWLISYSDFITLLFAFFVVMYAISQVNESKYRVLSESLIQAFRPHGNLEAKSITENKLGQPSTTPVPAGVIPHAAPHPEIPKEPPLPKLRDVQREVRKELDPLIKTGEARVADGTQGLSIEIDAKVLFKPGDTALTFESYLPLRNIARILARNAHQIRVEGHSDNERLNNEIYPSQWELSTARASRVVRYFIDNGVDPQRLTAAGYADTRAVEASTGRGSNRRVAILVLPAEGEVPATMTQLPTEELVGPAFAKPNQ